MSIAASFGRFASLLAGLRLWLLKQPFFTSKVMPAIPRPVRWTLRTAYFLPLELLDRVSGQSEEMVPPRTEIFTGSVSGFKKSGETLVERLTQYGGLQSDSKVLDIGSGMGRLAVPLTRRLGPDGGYEGLDIVPSGVKWCTENITAKHPNFRFTLADVFNKEYHPKGRYQARDYRFPYEDDTFDLVVLVSVFTHMLPPDMEHYVREISRVLKPGGRCFATYFLLNDESRRMMRSGDSALDLRHDLGGYWSTSEKTPELAIGYEESYVRDMFGRGGLFTKQEVFYGGWCGRKPFWSEESGLGDQDVVLATK